MAHVIESTAVIKISVIIVTDLPVRWHLAKNTPLARETCAFVHNRSVLALSTVALICLSVKEWGFVGNGVRVCVSHSGAAPALLRMWTQICPPANAWVLALNRIDRSMRYPPTTIHCMAVCQPLECVSYCLEALRPLTYFTTCQQSNWL